MAHPAAFPPLPLQHDAACRVIARLMRERDGYRQQLEAAQRAAPAEGAAGKRGGEAMDVDEGPAKKVRTMDAAGCDNRWLCLLGLVPCDGVGATCRPCVAL